MGKGPDKRGKPKDIEREERRPRTAMGSRLSRRGASLQALPPVHRGVKRKRCRRCIVPFVEDAALEQPVVEETALEEPPPAKRVKRQARVRTEEEKAALALARNPSSCSCSSGDED